MAGTRISIGIPGRPIEDKIPESLSIKTGDLLRWAWKHSRSEVPLIILGMVLALIISSLSGLVLIKAREFIEVVSSGEGPRHGLNLAVLLSIIFLGRSLLGMAASMLGSFASANIRKNLEWACLDHLSFLPYERMASKSGGLVSAALFNEIPMMADIPVIITRSFARAPFTILILCIILYKNLPLMGIMALLATPLVFVGMSSLAKAAKHASARAHDSISQLYARMSEYLGGMRTIRTLGLMDWYTRKLKTLSIEIAQRMKKTIIVTSLQGAVQEGISLILLMFALWWCAACVNMGLITLSKALLIPVALIMIKDEALAISGGIIGLRRIEGAAARIQNLLSERQSKDGQMNPKEAVEEVKLCGVAFGYEGGGLILEDVDLELRSGGITVLLGESGAGKSTLCDIVLGLRQATSGEVRYNGLPLQDLCEDYVMSQTALVDQLPYLFEGTVRENLLFGDMTATDSRVWQMLEAVSSANFVAEMGGKLDARVAPMGSNLSMGQRQRLVLARALLRQPHLLVLDEFTSALDPANEDSIMETILDLSKDIIVLCTTHRMSVARRAARVYCLGEGRLLAVRSEDLAIWAGRGGEH